jgi:hypothetical protein
MPGKRPLYTMHGVFDDQEDARHWIDRQSDRIWEEPLPAMSDVVAVSHGLRDCPVDRR